MNTILMVMAVFAFGMIMGGVADKPDGTYAGFIILAITACVALGAFLA